MSWNAMLHFSIPRAEGVAVGRTPVIASVLVGSLCCGGGLIFGAIGLGAFYGALGLARYIPEALATGAVAITLLNWLYYRRKAARMLPGCDRRGPRRMAMSSAFLGLLMMAASFILLEWLNHGVVRAAHFMHSPEFASAVIPGVPNSHLLYLAVTFLALPLLAMLPFTSKTPERR